MILSSSSLTIGRESYRGWALILATRFRLTGPFSICSRTYKHHSNDQLYGNYLVHEHIERVRFDSVGSRTTHGSGSSPGYRGRTGFMHGDEGRCLGGGRRPGRPRVFWLFWLLRLFVFDLRRPEGPGHFLIGRRLKYTRVELCDIAALCSEYTDYSLNRMTRVQLHRICSRLFVARSNQLLPHFSPSNSFSPPRSISGDVALSLPRRLPGRSPSARGESPLLLLQNNEFSQLRKDQFRVPPNAPMSLWLP